MITEQTIAIVKSTAGVLAKEGEAITTLFYRQMFDNHPELKHIFNMANQAKGEQAKALADSVFQYATHIDKLEALGDSVTRIAQKHASLQIAPAHYPIVGKYLLAAIQSHLSLNADDPILTAWTEAYNALAAIFISTEKDIYLENEQKPGGWRGDREFVIAQIVDEASEVKSFYLKPKDGQPIAGFKAGQYVGIKTTPDSSDYTEIRQYSLSNAPNNEIYRITVRAEAGENVKAGVVSNFLHHAAVGDVLLLQPPTGEFVIRQHKDDLVLLAGGVGITPVLSMLLERIDSGADVSKLTFIQCCRDKNHHIMADELKALQAQHGFNYHVSYEVGDDADFEGYLNAEILNQWLGNKQTDAYFCGPKPFMSAINSTLQEIGFAPEQLYHETFGPNIRLN